MKTAIFFIFLGCNIIGMTIGITSTGCSISSFSHILDVKTENLLQTVFFKPIVIVGYPGVWVGHKLNRPWSCK